MDFTSREGGDGMPPIKSIPIELITTEQGIYPRIKTSREVVERYAEAMEMGEKFPPIVVFPKGGKYVLLDGFHRKAAAEKIGLLEIDAEILDIDPNDTIAILKEAIKRNLLHGFPLTKQDLIRMAMTFYENGMPVKEISQLFRVPERTIHRWLEPIKELKRKEREELKQKAWRLHQEGWTQEAIARELGVARETVRDWIYDYMSMAETAKMAEMAKDKDGALAAELVGERVEELVRWAKEISDFFAWVAQQVYKIQGKVAGKEFYDRFVECLRELPENSKERVMLEQVYWGMVKNVELLAVTVSAVKEGNRAVKEAIKAFREEYGG